MPISQQGALNTTALVVPDLYVQIVAPQNLVINGVPTNILGVVGTATWGPVGLPTILSTMANYAQTFGAIQNRKYDMGTAVAVAVQQGASNFRCVRATDGTDTAASYKLQGSAASLFTVTSGGTGYTSAPVVKDANNVVVGIASLGTGGTATQVVSIVSNGAATTATGNSMPVTFTGGGGSGTTATFTTRALNLACKYTGTLGNQLVASIGPSSAVGGWKVTLQIPGLPAEVFDNIQNSGAGPSVWTDVQNAVNSGIGALRGPSNLVVASVPAAFGMPIVQTVNSSSASSTAGSDGATTVTASVLVGVDTIPRTGMYALRGQGVSIGMLADADDSTQWTSQVAFGLSEGIYMIGTGPAGDTIANATTVKATAGIDSYAFKLMFGDWIVWYDQTNQVTRLVSPQGFVAGLLANLSPEQSSLNKQLFGIVGSQKSGAPGSTQSGSYACADLQALFSVGIDVIANPSPGGTYWAVRCGHNSSSNAAINGDNYTRLTNYIAATLNASMGVYVGQVINQSLFDQISATQTAYFDNMLQQGLLGLNSDGSLPYSVICDSTNNPNSRTSLGYVQSDDQVRYQSINEKFIVNIEGGQTVQVQRQTLPAGQ